MTLLASVSLASGTVLDDGQTIDATSITKATTYRVTNNGLDNNIVAVSKNADGTIHDWINVGKNASHDIGVPLGGSLTIDDRNYVDGEGPNGHQNPVITDDSNTTGASYTTTS